MDIYCAFYDMDTNKVYAWQSDRNIVAIDCNAVENVEAENIYQRSESAVGSDSEGHSGSGQA